MVVVDSEDLQVVEFMIHLEFPLGWEQQATEVKEAVFAYNLLLIPVFLV